ncbi:MAG TPA: flagellar basal-body rod protein FlgG [Verrucomicrobiales bacterium]|nr:flagellar basal-body rod protein FlgG [Verrucomicrobiales bacterium]
MIRALYSAATGMVGQQTSLDVIANNLANVNTPGFKKSKIEFQDLIYQNSKLAGADVGGGNQTPTGIQVGHGSRIMSTAKVFTTGELQHSDSQLDVAINGPGFFAVTMADGSTAYTRDGSFRVDSTGRLVTSDGLPLKSAITIPINATDVSIAPTGEVTMRVGNANQTANLQIARFANPAGLDAIGRNLYKENVASGAAEEAAPGTEGYGTLAQNYIEGSNVKVVEEMVNMIVAQRAYEVNSKAVQTADEMLQMSDNLKR